MTKKEEIFSSSDGNFENDFEERIKAVSDGLFYMSETDAPWEVFRGESVSVVTKEVVLKQTDHARDEQIEERAFPDFFARLTKIQDWFGEREKEIARRYAKLQKTLEENLTELKVFRIGRIRIDIYAVGLDNEGHLTGVKTKAVET